MKTGVQQGFDIYEVLNLMGALEEKYDKDLSKHIDTMLYAILLIEVLDIYDNAELPEFFEGWN